MAALDIIGACYPIIKDRGGIVMRAGHGIFNGSLKRVLVLFLCASLVLTLLLMVISSSVYRGVMRSNTAKTVGLYASEQQKLLEDELQNMKTALYSLANKQEVEDYLNAGQGYKAANAKYINSLLSDIPNYVSCISDIVLVTPDQRFAAMSYNKSDMPNFLLRYELVRQYYDDGQTGLAWYTVDPAGDDSRFLLALMVPVQSARQTGLAVAFSTVEALLGKLSFSEKPFVLWHQGREIRRCGDCALAQDEISARLGTSMPDIQDGWARLRVKMTGWDLLIASPLITENDQLAAEMLRWNTIAILIFLLVECGLIWAIYKAIIAPITSISAQSARINSSASLIDNPAPGRNELNALVRNINDMMARTALLTEEVNRAKMRLMEMDIVHLKERNMFLQAQINPHFLYNMLECICGMATADGNQAIREMTHLLSRLYQYCLKSPESTLGEELECVGMYERIIRVRYGQGYRIDVVVPEDLLMLPLPRMVLEPLVENAVQHGFVRGSDQVFFVKITAELQENELEIRIADNGCGIPGERRERINERLRNFTYDRAEKGDRIGVYNVGTRLRLVYGEPSGLVLEENNLGGLTVRMRVVYPPVDALEEAEGGNPECT